MEYYIEDEIGREREKYVNVKTRIYKRGEKGFVEDSQKYQRVFLKVPNQDTVFLVTYIQHDGEDEESRAFFKIEEARKYIKALTTALISRHGNFVTVHNHKGKMNVYPLLTQIPLDTYTNFKTEDGKEFSLTLSRA